MIRQEIRELATWGDRHRRLIARLTVVGVLTLAVDVVGSILIYAFERDVRGGDINSFGDAMFFTTVQLLTISSQIRNPLTAAGRFVDVALEVWGLFVVGSVAGSIATFFSSAE
jgi:voltage-gated potassium channel